MSAVDADQTAFDTGFDAMNCGTVTRKNHRRGNENGRETFQIGFELFEPNIDIVQVRMNAKRDVD
jgi:hypothetical protein